MRHAGTLKTWNDERGFGFIAPSDGGHDIFMHIRAFQDRWERPAVGQALTYEIELNPEGKTRATHVILASETWANATRNKSSTRGSTPLGLVAIIAFAPIVYLEITYWQVPAWYSWVYVAASVISFILYAVDKRAAVTGGWRVPEARLLILGLVGGWPGAIIAQQLLRHKTKKVGFVGPFWVTVLLNVLAFVGLGAAIMSRLF